MGVKLKDYKGFGRNPLGLHWVVAMGHAHADLTYYIDRTRDMGVKWVVLLDDGGGSTMQVNPFYGKSIIEMFLERDIEPVIRIFAGPHAKFDDRMKSTVRRLVSDFDVRYVSWVNEPECGGEWEHTGRSIPSDWVRTVTRNFVAGAYHIMEVGAYPGFPATTTFQYPHHDNPEILVNPFIEYMSEQERQDIFVNGYGYTLLHPYAKNHPIDYPLDDVNQQGKHLTHEEYMNKLAEVDKGFRQTSGHLWVWEDWEDSESHINLLRDEKKNPGATLNDDSTCFLVYQGFEGLLEEAGLLPYVPIIGKETGPCVGERNDGRYARVTPLEQIKVIEQELVIAEKDPNLFCLCFWLAGVQMLKTTTADGFEDQSWWTAWQNAPFNLDGELPIVKHFIDKASSEGEQPKMKNKLGFHAQLGNDSLLDFDYMPVIKTMDLGPSWCEKLRQTYLDSLIVARAYVANQDRFRYDAAGLVSEMIGLYAPIASFVDVLEVPNEVINNSSSWEDVLAWDDFQIKFYDAVKQRWPDMKIGLMQTATGNLGIVGDEWELSDFPKSMALPIDDVYLCFHGYSWPSMRDGQGYYCLRYRLQTKDFPNHKILITECGVTNAVVQGQPDVGWRTHGDRNAYMDDLVWYNSELNKDPQVIGAMVFNCGPSFGWDSFESTEELKKVVSQFDCSIQDPEEPEEPPISPEGFPWDKDIVVTNDAESYGVTILKPTDIVLGSVYWKVKQVHHLLPDENNGNHHIYGDAFEYDSRVAVNMKVVDSFGNVGYFITDKPIGPYDKYSGNFPLWGHETNPPNKRSVKVTENNILSEVVLGIHPAHQGEYKEDGTLGNSLLHHSFAAMFEKVVAWEEQEEEPPVEPPIEPPASIKTYDESVFTQALSHACHDLMGFAYNPTFAFNNKAELENLGPAVSDEFDFLWEGQRYRAKIFARGTTWTTVSIDGTHGDWANIRVY